MVSGMRCNPKAKNVHEWRIEYHLQPNRWVLVDVSRPFMPRRYLLQGEHDGLPALIAACVAETRCTGGGRVEVVHPAVDSPMMLSFSGCGSDDVPPLDDAGGYFSAVNGPSAVSTCRQLSRPLACQPGG